MKAEYDLSAMKSRKNPYVSKLKRNTHDPRRTQTLPRPVYYVLAGDNDKALAFYTWFEAEFSDDIGEPVFDLYWVLAEYRAGNTAQARYRL